jgi:GDP-L-fucose synthase
MKVLVTGGSGMVGSCIKDECQKYEEDTYIFLSSKDGDLTKREDTEAIFEKHRPDYVIHLAANVGGLYKNMKYRVEMLHDNLLMNEYVLEMCNKYDVNNGLFCLSTCIFPHDPTKFPMTEEMMNDSAPHPSNAGYAFAKRLLEVQCSNYNEQFGRKYVCITPVNLYGPYDNFNLEDSHVIPGIIHRMHLAKAKDNNFVMYGSGKPLRQFLYTPDLAKIILRFIYDYKSEYTNIICCDQETTIKSITEKIHHYMDMKGEIVSDTSKSDGCMRKTVSNERFHTVFPDFKYTSIDEGLEKTIKWFNENYKTCRK